MPRRITRKLRVGSLEIGGGSRISVESMTNTDTQNVALTLQQIYDLQHEGCDIVRLAIYDMECTEALSEIKRQTNIPLVADIHFDYRLAVASILKGADMVRINPGNIGKVEGVKYLVALAKERDIPIRIGVNSGSLERIYLDKYGNTPRAMIESALNQISIVEDAGYDNILLSLKSSSVLKTIEACREISQLTDYPLHIGVTESGTLQNGTIKSAIGIGVLLLDGIGDTIRVSLTAPPIEEVRVGLSILKCLGLRLEGAEIISCPTCGRCRIDIIKIADEVRELCYNIKKPIKIAIMGCAVNGPGEAKEADIGIAGGDNKAMLFKQGKIERVLSVDEAVGVLIEEIKRMKYD